MAISVTQASGTTPGSGTVPFQQVKSDIAVNFGLDNDPDKVAWIGRTFCDVIDDLNRKKLWRFNLIAGDEFQTVAGVSDYAIPSDLWGIYSTRKQDEIDFLMTGLRQRNLDVMFQSQNGITGYPYVTANFNLFRDGTIKLFPIPDAAYTMLIRYFKLIPYPTDNGFLDVPRPYQSVPKYRTLSRVAEMLGQSSSALYWEALYQTAYDEMNSMDEDDGDEDLRFISIDEMRGRGTDYINPNVRPRFLDLY